jgi:hypothetical protein
MSKESYPLDGPLEEDPSEIEDYSEIEYFEKKIAKLKARYADRPTNKDLNQIRHLEESLAQVKESFNDDHL